jgi:hypothetical protein
MLHDDAPDALARIAESAATRDAMMDCGQSCWWRFKSSSSLKDKSLDVSARSAAPQVYPRPFSPCLFTLRSEITCSGAKLQILIACFCRGDKFLELLLVGYVTCLVLRFEATCKP